MRSPALPYGLLSLLLFAVPQVSHAQESAPATHPTSGPTSLATSQATQPSSLPVSQPATQTKAPAKSQPANLPPLDKHLQTNLLAFFFGEILLEYAAYGHRGWGGAARVWYWKYGEEPWDWQIFALGASLRRSLKRQPQGFFFGVAADLEGVQATRAGIDGSAFLLTPALEFGFHKDFGRFGLVLGGAIEYTVGRLEISQDPFPHLGLGPNVIVGVGYRLMNSKEKR